MGLPYFSGNSSPQQFLRAPSAVPGHLSSADSLAGSWLRLEDMQGLDEPRWTTNVQLEGTSEDKQPTAFLPREGAQSQV